MHLFPRAMGVLRVEAEGNLRTEVPKVGESQVRWMPWDCAYPTLHLHDFLRLVKT